MKKTTIVIMTAALAIFAIASCSPTRTQAPDPVPPVGTMPGSYITPSK